MYHPDYGVLAVEENDVDGAPHARRVDRPTRPKPQALIVAGVTLQKQPLCARPE